MPITLPVTANGSCGSMSDAARFLIPVAALLHALFGTLAALAGFVPGYLYVSDTSPAACFDGGPPDQIWEVNPETGESRLFATRPPGFCGSFQGLAFTPDGQRLRVGSFLDSQILEIDGDGNFSVALGPEDGLNPPSGFNNLAYDADGNFFVGTVLPDRVLKFPADGSPRTVFANRQDGITGSTSLAFGPTGELYVTVFSGPTYRFQPDGEGELLTSLAAVSVVVDANKNAYLWNPHGLYRLPADDPDAPELVVAWPPDIDGFPGSLALSLDQQSLLLTASNLVRRIDLVTAEITTLPDIPGYGAGHGSALYVPEPNSALTSTIFAIMLIRVRRVAVRQWSSLGGKECTCTSNPP